MSYARFGVDGSHVYVYRDTDGRYLCCGCPSLDDEVFVCASASEIVEHLELDRANGHIVPQPALDRLRAEVERRSGAPGHTLCDYERCNQAPTVTLPRGAVMCPHHAAVTLLAGMSAEGARSAFRSARPVTAALGRTRELLRRFLEQYDNSEGDAELLLEVLGAFEEEDANG